MTNKEKIGLLENRRKAIIARGKYQKCPGALKKVERMIKNLKG